MQNRWAMLGLLFAARTVMAMQFQVIGALSPAIMARFGVSLGDVGLAIGLYFAAGVVLAFPGGTIAARFGERLVSGVALAMMALGGAVMALTDSWSIFLAAQLVAGAGGSLVNVSMTKMVTDVFQGKDIATALSVFINSWPVGIALSLVLTPVVAATFGASAALGAIAGLAAIMAVLVPLLYRSDTSDSLASRGRWPRGVELKIALASGVVWGSFNAGLAVVFGFGTAFYVDVVGLEADAAARLVSLVLWSLALTAPLGGVLSDRSSRPLVLIGAGLAALALLTVAVPVWNGHWMLMVMIGVASGLVAGPIMSLPARSLPADARAISMGLFFTLYYVAFLVTPPIAGWFADQQGNLLAAFITGCVLQLLALAALVYFARLKGVRE